MKKLLFALILTVAAVPARAFDGPKLAQNLRETLSLDTRTSIEVQGEPHPSSLGSLNKVSVLVGGAPYDVYLTTDSKVYFWGFAAKLDSSPDQERVKGISLKTGHSVGLSSAPVTIVEYSDFGCQYCKRAYDILNTELYKNYSPGQVRLVFKHYPLTTHPWAFQAAMSAECASRQKPNAFFKMADFFFGSQEDINEGNISEKVHDRVKSLGLKTATFDACMEDKALKEQIAAEKKEGATIGVSSTPTLFINGRMRRGFRDFSDIKVVIDEKLKDAGH